jgi:lipid A disaccharide synthetase
MLKSRRRFLITGIFTGGAILVGAGLNYKYKPRSRIIARQLISYLKTIHLANIIGASLITNEKYLQGLSLDQLIDRTLDDVNLTRSDFSLLKLSSQLNSFQNQVRKDFANEKIVLVNGWVLSVTEAHLCAVLHRYQNPLS